MMQRVHAPEKRSCLQSRQKESGQFAARGFARRGEDSELEEGLRARPRSNCSFAAVPLFPPVQAKMMVGSADDEYEREADRIAEQAVSMPVSGTSRSPLEDEELHAMPMIQRKGSEGAEAERRLQRSIDMARGSGAPLSGGFRSRMEEAFGVDFSSVRVHLDANADRMNRSIQSRAFTTGRDIFLRQGEYRPESSEGQRLLAHELAHVVQQESIDIPNRTGQEIQQQFVIQCENDESDDDRGDYEDVEHGSGSNEERVGRRLNKSREERRAKGRRREKEKKKRNRQKGRDEKQDRLKQSIIGSTDVPVDKEEPAPQRHEEEEDDPTQIWEMEIEIKEKVSIVEFAESLVDDVRKRVEIAKSKAGQNKGANWEDLNKQLIIQDADIEVYKGLFDWNKEEAIRHRASQRLPKLRDLTRINKKLIDLENNFYVIHNQLKAIEEGFMEMAPQKEKRREVIPQIVRITILNPVPSPNSVMNMLPGPTLSNGSNIASDIINHPTGGNTGLTYRNNVVYHSSARSSVSNQSGTAFWFTEGNTVSIIAMGNHAGTSSNQYNIIWRAQGVIVNKVELGGREKKFD